MAADKPDTKATKKHEGLPRKWKSKANADESNKKELEKRNSTKYKMLKFFEMQKVERKLNSCRRLLLLAKEENRSEDVDALKLKLKAHLADHEYITYYPKHLPYNALFPKEDSEASKRRREEVRKLIQAELAKKKEIMADDTVLGSLREEEIVKEITKDSSKKAKPSVTADGDVADKAKAKKSKNAKAREKRRLRRMANVESSSPPQSPAVAEGKKKKKKQDVASPSDDVTPVLDGKKKKKRSASAAATNLSVDCSNVEADAGAKKLKKRKEDVALLEQPESGKAHQKGDREPKKKRKATSESGRTGDDSLHPSWQGKKSTKISGAMVESTGKRQVFESDDE